MKWIGPQSVSAAAQKLAHDFLLPEVLAQVLLNRRLDDPQVIENFFSANLSQIHDPYLLKDMDVAVTRLVQAIQNHESICVFGDYDVDGAVSTSLFVLFFRELGIPLRTYIPHRVKEGYSLSKESVKFLADSGVQLIVTVDNGIMAFDQIEYAHSLGVDVIVTDHHKTAETLPRALAIVNPQRADCTYPFKGICGAGVAFKVLMALRIALREINFFKDRSEPNLKKYLDFLAIATVCDVVPLVDENRTFVREGLKVLERSFHPGLQALKQVCGLKGEISASDLGFKIGPRINACGRLEDASLGVKTLVSQNVQEALDDARVLDQLNQERRSLEALILEKALVHGQSQLDDQQSAMVVFDPEWHVGVVGIVASRLVDLFHRPAFVLAQSEKGLLKGSGRSVSGVNLVAALNDCADLLLQYGGHEAAAGLTMEEKNLPAFRDAFCAAISKQKSEWGEKELQIDAELSKQHLDFSFWEQLCRLEPFGSANRRPVFVSRHVQVVHKRIVGEQHIKFSFNLSDGLIDGIAFRQGDRFQSVPDMIDVAYQLDLNEFNGHRSLQWIVLDWQDSTIN